MTSSSLLTPTQKYAAGALFAFALHKAQIHQTHPLGSPGDEDSIDERFSSCSSSDSVGDDPELWVHESSRLLRPVFRFLEIDSVAWPGLEETAGTSPAKNHIGAFLMLLSEEGGVTSSEMTDMEIALVKGVDAMALSMESSSISNSKKEKHREYENEYREKYSTPDPESKPEVAKVHYETQLATNSKLLSTEEASSGHDSKFDEKPVEEVRMLSYQKKVAVLYELLSACLADLPEDNKKHKQRRKGYDARHRVALRLLATWFDLKWTIVMTFGKQRMREERPIEEEDFSSMNVKSRSPNIEILDDEDESAEEEESNAQNGGGSSRASKSTTQAHHSQMQEVKPLYDEVILTGVAPGKNQRGAKNWICKHCNTQYSRSYTRIHAHFFCGSAGKNPNVKRCSTILANRSELERIRKRVQEAEKAGISSSLKSSKLTKRFISETNPIENSFRAMDRDMVDLKVIRGLCANGISFNVLRNPHFHEMVSAINSGPQGYKAPSFEKAKTTLLDKCKTGVERDLIPNKETWL